MKIHTLKIISGAKWFIFINRFHQNSWEKYEPIAMNNFTWLLSVRLFSLLIWKISNVLWYLIDFGQCLAIKIWYLFVDIINETLILNIVHRGTHFVLICVLKEMTVRKFYWSKFKIRNIHLELRIYTKIDLIKIETEELNV